MGDWTWIRGNVDSDLSIPGLLDKALEKVSAGSGEALLSGLFDDSYTLTWFSPIGEPESVDWRGGETITAKLRIVTANTRVSITAVNAQRIREDGTFVALYGTSLGVPIVASAGVKTFTMTSVAQSGERTTDRLRVGFTLLHNGTLGSDEIGIGYGTSSDTIAVPIQRDLLRYRAAAAVDPASLTASPASLGPRATAVSLGPYVSTIAALNAPEAAGAAVGPKAGVS